MRLSLNTHYYVVAVLLIVREEGKWKSGIMHFPPRQRSKNTAETNDGENNKNYFSAF
jgi:hypothetical protein